jgi:hypothetical protein
MPVLSAQTNYIRHLNAFFAQVRKEHRLHANHVSLYLALFQVWNCHRFQNPFPVLREEVMSLSCIGSRATYVRCLKHLHHCGYISYVPAKQAYAASYVSIVPLAGFLADACSGQLFLFGNDKAGTMRPKSEPQHLLKSEPHMWPGIGPRSGPKVGHFNKHINNSKQEGENRLPPPAKKSKHETGNPQGNPGMPGATRALPALPEVKEFFGVHGYPAVEAGKFFHHYQANGWRQGGKTLITNWQAAAHKWILNIHAQKCHDTHTKQSTRSGNLHSNENKSYSDPL